MFQFDRAQLLLKRRQFIQHSIYITGQFVLLHTEICNLVSVGALYNNSDNSDNNTNCVEVLLVTATETAT